MLVIDDVSQKAQLLCFYPISKGVNKNKVLSVSIS